MEEIPLTLFSFKNILNREAGEEHTSPQSSKSLYISSQRSETRTHRPKMTRTNTGMISDPKMSQAYFQKKNEDAFNQFGLLDMILEGKPKTSYMPQRTKHKMVESQIQEEFH